MKLSVCIPYKQRLANLTLALEGLSRQTIDAAHFEVVIGAMELCHDLVEVVRRFDEKLSLVTVLSGRDFAIPRARNLAMRQASGEVVVQMDADTLLSPEALAALYDGCFASGQSQCVAGQVVGYDNNRGGDVLENAPLTVDEHLAALAAMCDGPEPPDPRFRVAHNVPWMFAWTGLIALRRETVVANDLYFDESFHGWGVDDLEWGFRVSRAGTPIVLRREVAALHLPHPRDRAGNDRTERLNYQRFLRKWPQPDVELASAIGDLRANDEMPAFRAALEQVLGLGSSDRLFAVGGRVQGRQVVHLGIRIDSTGCLVDPLALPTFDAGSPTEVLPLVGISLPYLDGDVGECVLHPGVQALPTPFRELVGVEVERLTSRGVNVGHGETT